MGKEYLIPGSFVNETSTRQAQYSGFFVNETAAAENATQLFLSGPTQGATGVASSNFTVQSNGYIENPVTVTVLIDKAGVITPETFILQGADSIESFTITPSSGGAIVVSITNDGGLTNPSSLTYTSIDLPTAVITTQLIEGQNISISGTVQSNPTSGTATLVANIDGITQGPTAVTINSGTFTVSWNEVPPGTYNAPDIKFTNIVGEGPSASGGSSITILAIDGDVTEPDTPAENQATTITVSSPNSVEDGSSITITLSTDYPLVDSETESCALDDGQGGTFSVNPVILDASNQSVDTIYTPVGGVGIRTLTVTPTGTPTLSTRTKTINVIEEGSTGIAPTAVITTQNLVGNDLTLSGTYTETPTTASATITAVTDGETQSNVSVTFSNGTWSVTFNDLVDGTYSVPVVNFTNQYGSNVATGGSSVTVDYVPDGEAPTATITSQNLSSDDLSVSGTYTGIPDSVIANLTATNAGESRTGVNVTFSNGTWSVLFSDLIDGEYSRPEVVFTNVYGSNTATGGSSLVVDNVPDGYPPTAEITSQSLVGNDLTVSGTYTQTPTSASATIIALVDGLSQTDIPVTFSNGTWTVTFNDLVDGEYDTPVVSFTNAYGSNDATGGNSVIVITPDPASVSITSSSITLSSIHLEGTVDLQDDVSGTLVANVRSVPPGTSFGPFTITPTGGTWYYDTQNLDAGSWIVEVVASANNLEDAIDETNTYRILGLSGTKKLPIV